MCMSLCWAQCYQALSTTYVQPESEPESLKRILQEFNVRTVMRPHQTLKQRLVHPKDAIPDMEKSGVIYCIPCAECPATYVGETKRKLGKRMDEHKRAVRMADFNVSAVAEHAWSAGHGVDWNGVTILDQYKDLHPRLALEAFHIWKQPLPLNRDRSSLPPAYDHLLKALDHFQLCEFFYTCFISRFFHLYFQNFPPFFSRVVVFKLALVFNVLCTDDDSWIHVVVETSVDQIYFDWWNRELAAMSLPSYTELFALWVIMADGALTFGGMGDGSVVLWPSITTSAMAVNLGTI